MSSDARASFYDEVRSRKALLSSSRKRVCGRKSRSCKLPQDHMTQKQWKERNGKVKMFNIHEAMTWEAFCALPRDLQQDHLTYLSSQFTLSWAGLCSCFRDSPAVSEVRELISKNGLRFSASKGRVSQSTQKAIASFVGILPSPPANEKKTEERKPKSEKPPANKDFVTKGFSIAFEGIPDLVVISDFLHKHLPRSTPCEVTISVRCKN